MYKKINISEKGPYTFNKYHWKTKRSRVDEGRERNQEVDKKKINSIFNCKTDYWSLGVMLYIGHTDNISKDIQPQLKPVNERTVPRTFCWKLDKGKSHFFETTQLLTF